MTGHFTMYILESDGHWKRVGDWGERADKMKSAAEFSSRRKGVVLSVSRGLEAGSVFIDGQRYDPHEEEI